MRQKRIISPITLSVIVSEELSEYLRVLAFKKRISKGRLIREAINKYIADEKVFSRDISQGVNEIK